MTESGTGTWDLGREDLGTPGCGTRGRREVGLGDTGTWDVGTLGCRTRGLGMRGCGGLKDMINKQHLIFSLNLLSTNFGTLKNGIACWRVCQQTSS